MNPDECVSPRGHSWYLIRWSQKRGRYERECSLMGCTAWQYLEGSVIAEKKIEPYKEDRQHVHEWKPWNGVEEDTIEDDLRYYRNCKYCNAQERTAELKVLGTWVYFPAEVAIRG